MARVAVLVSNPCTGDARVIKMAQAAVEAGHEVHVFATSGGHAKPFEEKNGVIYHRIEWRPGELLTGHGPLAILKRVNRYLAGAVVKKINPFLKYRLFSKIFSDHVAGVCPDIIHAHDLICLPAAYVAANKCNARLVYDAHELETHRNPPLPFFQKKFVGFVENKYANRADAVITVGRLVGEVLADHINRRDINIIYNSPLQQNCPRTIRQDLRIESDVPLIIYVGKVTAGRGVGDILALLSKMPNVVFATIGPCDIRVRDTLEAQAKKLNLNSRFHVLPAVPFEQVVGYIQGADVGVISVEPVTLSYQYCMPNKLFELSFANVPIISNKLDEIEGFISEFGNGQVVDFSDKASLAYKIFRMLEEKNNYLIDGDKKGVLYEKYSWEAQKYKLKSIYESLFDS